MLNCERARKRGTRVRLWTVHTFRTRVHFDKFPAACQCCVPLASFEGAGSALFTACVDRTVQRMDAQFLTSHVKTHNTSQTPSQNRTVHRRCLRRPLPIPTLQCRRSPSNRRDHCKFSSFMYELRFQPYRNFPRRYP